MLRRYVRSNMIWDRSLYVYIIAVMSLSWAGAHAMLAQLKTRTCCASHLYWMNWRNERWYFFFQYYGKWRICTIIEWQNLQKNLFQFQSLAFLIKGTYLIKKTTKSVTNDVQEWFISKIAIKKATSVNA